MLFTASAAKADQSGPIFGISEPDAWRHWPAHASPDEIARLVHDVGASSHEFWVHWDTVEPNAPVDGVHNYDFAAYDQMYQADLAQGIRPLITVQSAPRWTWAPGITNAWLPEHAPSSSHQDDWRAFIAELTRRYPQAVGVQIWNEPNLKLFWGLGDPLDPTDPAAYNDLLKQAYEAVKGVDSAMPVIAAGLSNNQVSVGGQISESDFIRAMLRDGAADYMDGIGVHPYPVFVNDSYFARSMNQIRSALADAGVSKPIWVTEVGMTTTGGMAVTEDQQAQVAATLFRQMEAMPDVAAFYFHNLTEVTQDPSSDEKGFGLVRGQGVGSQFEPKPAYLALKHEAEIAAAPPVTPPSDPPPTDPPATDPPVTTPPPPANIPTVLQLVARSEQRAVAHGAVLVRAGCDQEACQIYTKGKLRTTVRGRGMHRARLRHSQFSVPAGQPVKLKLRLSANQRRSVHRALARGGRSVAKVKITAVDKSGDAVSKIAKIRLKG